MKLLLSVSFILLAQYLTTADPDITGVWESRGRSGNIFGLTLNKDGTFSTYVNRKAFTSGNYSFTDGMLTVVEENGCTDSVGAKIKAVYKAVFFVTDSIRLEVVSDLCDPRRQAVDGSRYGRVKKPMIIPK
jgi:hypothetical protein